jgi:hypothetical protein
VATATERVEIDVWAGVEWLNSEEALDLREQEQVVNLAYLDRGGAKYHPDKSVRFGDNWVMKKPLGVSNLTLNGTNFEMVVNGDEYSLNVYQPFVIDDQPEVIYLVDDHGQVWMIDWSPGILVDLEIVQEELQLKLLPNSNLSPTY